MEQMGLNYDLIIEDEKEIEKNEKAKGNSIMTLRKLKQNVISRLSSVERSCIIEYELEQYLIQRYFGYNGFNTNNNRNRKHYYKGNSDSDSNDNDDIEAILTTVRSLLTFWVKKSETYLSLSCTQIETEFEKKYINKDLYAIYNYIHLNGIKDDEDKDKGLNPSPITKEQILLNDILNRETLIGDYNQESMSIYSLSVLRSIYAYVIEPHSFRNEFDQLKLQNLIVFFLSQNDDLYRSQLNKKGRETQNKQPLTKRYSLRNVGKKSVDYHNDMFLTEQKSIESQIRLMTIKENINKVVNDEPIKSIMAFCAIASMSYNEIVNKSLLLCENSEHSEEANSDFIFSALKLLSNVISLSECYLNRESTLPQIHLDISNCESNAFFVKQCRRILMLPKYSFDKNSLNELIVFYCNVIEYNSGYDACLRTQAKRKDGGTKEDDALVSKACDAYMIDYYHNEQAKQLRNCYMKNNNYRSKRKEKDEHNKSTASKNRIHNRIEALRTKTKAKLKKRK